MQNLKRLVLAAAALCATAAHATDLKVTGITPGNQLVTFMSDSNAAVVNGPVISGLAEGDVALIGADYRVQNKLLYVVGAAGGIYTVDTATGAATQVSTLTVGLTGTAWGVDFNPAADRLRIISNDGQNLRHNVNSGGTTIADDPLDYPPGTPANTVGPTATNVVAAAYSNNDLLASTGTVLYNIDAMRDQVVVQSPPNNGSLAAFGLIGGDVAPTQVSFDAYTQVNGAGSPNTNTGVAVMTVNGVRGVYVISLGTGRAALRYRIATDISHIAIPITQ